MTAQITHADWQATIHAAARVLGWDVMHVRKTIGKGKRWTTATSVVGWPDLLLWHPKHGFAAIEVKIHPDKPTTEQLDVLASLAAAGARTLIAYPEHWDLVTEILTGQAVAA